MNTIPTLSNTQRCLKLSRRPSAPEGGLGAAHRVHPAVRRPGGPLRPLREERVPDLRADVHPPGGASSLPHEGPRWFRPICPHVPKITRAMITLPRPLRCLGPWEGPVVCRKAKGGQSMSRQKPPWRRPSEKAMEGISVGRENFPLKTGITKALRLAARAMYWSKEQPSTLPPNRSPPHK